MTAPYPLVVVRWLDAYSDDGEQDVDDVLRVVKARKPKLSA